MIVLDTSGLLAALDKSEARHVAAVSALKAAPPPRLLSPFVLAELDYLLSERVARTSARALLNEISAGAYQLEPFTSDDVAAAIRVQDRYANIALGLADASVVVLADRHQTIDILTLDERHFRSLRDAGGRRFRLLPADLAA